MEQHFIDNGMLLPSFHKQYWLGLTTTSWPRFRWLDPATKPLNSSGERCCQCSCLQSPHAHPQTACVHAAATTQRQCPRLSFTAAAFGSSTAGAYSAFAKGEPNNRFSPEFCGVSDMTRMSRGAGGWADENCAQQNIYICRITRGSSLR